MKSTIKDLDTIVNADPNHYSYEDDTLYNNEPIFDFKKLPKQRKWLIEVNFSPSVEITDSEPERQVPKRYDYITINFTRRVNETIRVNKAGLSLTQGIVTYTEKYKKTSENFYYAKRITGYLDEKECHQLFKRIERFFKAILPRSVFDLEINPTGS